MVAFSRFTGGLAAAALGGAALFAAPAVAFAQPAATVVVPCDTSALASAINTANSTIGPTTLQLAPFCTYNIFTPATLTDGLPVIKNDITLAGTQNTVIRRSPLTLLPFRLIEVGATGDLTVSKLSLMNGISLAGNGGAILDGGTLHVTNSTISRNTARNGGGILVETGASATVSSTLMNLNSASGVLSTGGGAIATNGFLALFNTVIDSNTANYGGGLLVAKFGNLVTEQTTITKNTARKLGGGILNDFGRVSLNGTQVRLNLAANAGGIGSTNNNVTLRSTIVKKNTPNTCPAPLAYCLN